MHGVKLFTGAAVSVLLLALAGPTPALADTIEAALVRAYQNNPQLNAQRAQVRSTDENVPQALSGYRPKVNLTVTSGNSYQDIQTQQKGAIVTTDLQPNSASLTVNQTLYNGNQTANRTRTAESQVSGSREALRSLDQSVLLSAATTYMDYLRDAATLEVQRSNVRVLEQTLKQTRDRFNVGEVTRTDVAQSEAQLAAGKTQALTAEANLNTTRAAFRRVIGNEPSNLAPGSPVDRFLPATLAAAVELGLVEHPDVTSTMYGVDVNFLQVKVAEGALLPTVSVQASVSTAYQQTFSVFRTNTASAIATASVPIFQGGAEYSLIRQSKENLAQQRLNLEKIRDQVRANVVQFWGSLQAGKAQVQSAQAQVTASEIALNGVREEAKAGQRTTLDVLNAVGRLAPQVLGLNTTVYDPSVHYQQVRDSWAGVRTPDGR